MLFCPLVCPAGAAREYCGMGSDILFVENQSHFGDRTSYACASVYIVLERHQSYLGGWGEDVREYSDYLVTAIAPLFRHRVPLPR